MKKNIIKTVCSLLCASSLFLSAVTAHAEPANYLVSATHTYGTTGTGVTMATADISTPNYPDMYNPSMSATWSMIGGYSKYYAQVGYMNNNGTSSPNGPRPIGMHYFFAICYGVRASDGMNDEYDTFSTTSPALGSTHTYQVIKSGDSYIGSVGGTQIGSGGTSSKTFIGADAQFAEEIGGDPATNAAFTGTTSNPTVFSNIKATFNGYTYSSPTLSFTSGSSAGTYDNSSYPTTFKMWDTRR